MKLSAPPPPPPPPEPPAPGEQPPAGAAAAAPEQPAAPPADAPKLATWPAWFAGCDAALAALALVLAFAAASFVAHNSDLWVHLAAGKRLFAGEYVPGGSDPFSYAAAGRTWVNHSWLTDAAAYLLYGGEGKVLVIAKALLVVLAFGLLLAIRRAPFALWPWAVLAAVAALAGAPQFALRPLVVSLPLLAVTLVLLFRVPHRPGSWRFPGLVAGTFWVWANCDQWFFLGPLALALVLAGELVQAKLFGTPGAPAADAPDEPLGRLPDVPALARALALGALACTLTPHHVRVWELPVELVGAPGMDADPRLRALLFAPLDKEALNGTGLFLSNASLGYNLNGLAYAVLFVGGALALGFGPGRVRAAHVALWVGFAALGLLSMYAIPFFALVAVPLVAAQWNAASARATLTTWGNPRTRVLWTGSVLGRVACLCAGLGLCAAAYPGWLHPDPSNPAYARRVAWGVEPEPALVRAAEELERWRATGALPPDARGLIAHPDLANYVAWFAPSEKVFVNGRVLHHKPELGDYLAVRKIVAGRDREGEQPKLSDLTAVLQKLGAEYLALHGGPSDTPQSRARATEVATELSVTGAEWAPWLVDGRTAAFGWAGAQKPSFAALRVDPVVLAYGAGAARLPEYELKPPLVELGWEEPFVRPAKAAPVAAAEAFGWLRYKAGPQVRMQRRQLLRERVILPLFYGVPGTTDRTLHRLAVQYAEANGALRYRDDEDAADVGESRAIGLLALRAARRAIAEDPDHPDGYAALAAALQDRDLPFTAAERGLGLVVALRQCLARMPKPDRYRRGQFAVGASDAALQLALGYLGQQLGRRDAKGKEAGVAFLGMPIDVDPFGPLFGQYLIENGRTGELIRTPNLVPVAQLPPELRSLSGAAPVYLPADAALEALQLAQQYLAADLAGVSADVAQGQVRELAGLTEEVKKAVVAAKQKVAAARTAKLPEQVEAAWRNGLPAEALELLRKYDADLPKEYGDRLALAAAARAALELICGQAESGVEILDRLTAPDNAAAAERIAPLVMPLKYQSAVLVGNYRLAGKVLEEYEGGAVGFADAAKKLAELKFRPLDLILTRFGEWPPIGGLGAPLPALSFRLASGEHLERLAAARQSLASKQQQDARFFMRRGVLALLEGDIPGAKARFELSKREPLPGWFLEPVQPRESIGYLDLIAAAERRAAGGKK